MKAQRLFCAAMISAATCFIGCSNEQRSDAAQPPQPATTAQSRLQHQLVTDILGVWASGQDVVYIARDGAGLMLVIEGVPRRMQVGDIDEANSSVNLVATRDDGARLITTMRKAFSTDRASFNLEWLVEGERIGLSFVRRIGSDDQPTISAYLAMGEDEVKEADLKRKLASAYRDANAAQEAADQAFRMEIARTAGLPQQQLAMVFHQAWPEELDKRCGPTPPDENVSEQSLQILQCRAEQSKEQAERLSKTN